MLAKPYPLSAPTNLPQTHNQLQCMSKGAHQVLRTIFVSRIMTVFSIKSFVTEPFYFSLHYLFAAHFCYTYFDRGRICPEFNDPVPEHALLYLCVDLILTSEDEEGFLKVSGLRFVFAGTRRSSAPGGHLVGPGDNLPARTWWGALHDTHPAWWRSPLGSRGPGPCPSLLPHIATPRSVRRLATVVAGVYPLGRPSDAWLPGLPAPLGPWYWLVASHTPMGWHGGCVAARWCVALCATTALPGAVPWSCVRGARGRSGGSEPVLVLSFPLGLLPSLASLAVRVARCRVRVTLLFACWYCRLGPVALSGRAACPFCVLALLLPRLSRPLCLARGCAPPRGGACASGAVRRLGGVRGGDRCRPPWGRGWVQVGWGGFGRRGRRVALPESVSSPPLFRHHFVAVALSMEGVVPILLWFVSLRSRLAAVRGRRRGAPLCTGCQLTGRLVGWLAPPLAKVTVVR